MANLPIIVGLDPGTTASFAVIDFFGKVISINSSKEYNLSKIILEISKLGLPLIVSTDKANIPDFVKNFSAKTGAKINSPEKDLLTEDKRIITQNYKTNNNHELDALASALFALKKYKIIANKIKRFCIINNLSKETQNKLFFYVILKSFSINYAYSLINQKDIPKKEHIKTNISNQNNSKTFIEKINTLNEQINFYETENLELKQKLKKQKEENKKLNKLLLKDNSPINKQNIHSMNLKLNELNKKNNILNTNLLNEKVLNTKLKEDLIKFNKIVLNFSDYIIIKRINKQNINLFFKENFLKFNIIYLDDLKILNKIHLDNIIKKNIIIVSEINNYNKLLNEKIIILDLKKLNLIKTKNYCFVLKKQFNLEFSKLRIVERVINDYKKERKDNLKTINK
jgi:predicted RNase H-like nuclease (RuvC/YqgF family)